MSKNVVFLAFNCWQDLNLLEDHFKPLMVIFFNTLSIESSLKGERAAGC